MKTHRLHASRSARNFAVAACLSVAFCAAITTSKATPGDVFVADNTGQKIYQYTPPNLDGILTNAVSFPVGLAIDAAGNVYEADNGSNNIFKFTPSGTKTTFASGFVGVSGLAFDKSGNLFATDVGTGGTSGFIYKITPAGDKTVFASGLSLPRGLAFDPAGNLYESEQGSAQGDSIINKFTPSGVKSVLVDFGFNHKLLGLAIDPTGKFLYAAEPVPTPLIRKVDLAGGNGSIFTQNISQPAYLAFDAAGKLYVTNNGSSSDTAAVYIFATDGTRTTLSSGLSSPAGIAVAPSTPVASQLLNISTRLNVLAGDNALIGGFIITGTDAKKVLLRAIGPSLTAAGVTGALQDPKLELHDASGATIATNDNWRMTQLGGVITADQQADIQNSGAAPTNDKESAIIATLSPAGYTAVVRGVNDTTGIGVVEAYDLNQAAASKLANISTRGFVDTGDNAMIGGFILGPATGASAKVVVRGIGPSLSAFGVNNVLQNPILELHNENGATLVTNDNWRQDPAATEIQSDGLAPKSDFESATLQVLAPGAYTAILRGVQNGTGVGLIEVYNVQ
ncbi:MAG: NHL repeat-containing protein [Verrucomicrobiota bacterium]|nr:NHL repeat-containing protein [Verrucomicrobiota bacterium]